MGYNLWGPAAHTPLVISVMCSASPLHVGCMGLSVVADLTTVDVTVGRAGPQPCGAYQNVGSHCTQPRGTWGWCLPTGGQGWDLGQLDTGQNW